MATIDATVGGANSNSYVTLVEADAYFADTLRAAIWEALYPGDKEVALIESATDIDMESYVGSKTDSDQALKFPRTDIWTDERVAYDSDAIPRAVKSAQCELAYIKLTDPDSLETDGLSRYKSISLGQGEIAVTPRHGLDNHLPDKVLRLLSHLKSGSMRAVRS